MNEPTPSAPQDLPPRSPSRVRLAIYIAIAVAAMVLIAAAALLLVRIGGIGFYDRASAMLALRDIAVAERSYESVAPSRFGLSGLEPIALPGLTGVSDYAHAKGTRAAIAHDANGVPQVFLLGRDPVPLTGSDAAKASLDVSPDGKYIAYAVRSDGASSYAPELSAWSVHVLTVADGTDADLGSGFGPTFFARDGATWLLYTGADALTVARVGEEGTFTSFSTPFEVVDDVWFAAKASPDGRYLAFRDAATRQFGLYSIYRVTVDMPLGLEPLGTDLVGLYDVAFAGGSIYGVDSFDGGIEGGVAVLKVDPQSDAEGKPVYLFPASGNYRFIP